MSHGVEGAGHKEHLAPLLLVRPRTLGAYLI